MRRLIRWAAALYPRSWRDRYGGEFQALLDDLPPRWRDFTDILRGAFLTQLTSTNAWKFAGAMALVGGILAFAASFAAPRRYISSAAIRIENDPGGQLDQIQQQVLSRSTLAELITRPSLDLYRRERAREPMEDIIEQMRGEIRIRSSGGAIEISFAYPDRSKAQSVAQALATRFVEGTAARNRSAASRWRNIWPQESPPAIRVGLLAPASLPGTGVGPNRLAFAAVGLGAGLLLGLAVAFRRAAIFAACGLVLGAAASYLTPAVYTSTAVMRVTPPDVPRRLVSTIEPVSAPQRLEQMRNQVLSEMAEHDRSRVVIRTLGPMIFSISASAADPQAAQGMVRRLVTRFTDGNFQDGMAVARQLEPLSEIRLAYEYKLGPNLEVIDPATLPQASVSPNRLIFAAAGVFLGIATAVARHRKNFGLLDFLW